MRSVEVRDFDQWQGVVSRLAHENVAPHEINWQTGKGGLFDEPSTMKVAPALCLPPEVRERLEQACGFLDEERWSLPYRGLWRWLHGERSALLPGDPDGTRLARRARAVCGDAHAMKGFLRFRERPADQGEPRFVAWYEPKHAVLPEVACHFASRMGKTAWLIATPQGTAAWDGRVLAFGAAEHELVLGADLTEELWLRYYRNTFNPERLNEKVLQTLLPRQNRGNLPEASLIPELVCEAKLGISRETSVLPLASENEIPVNCQTECSARVGFLHGLDACRRCELWESATHPVGGSGPADAQIVIVGEQADDHDDLIGEPFSGPLGRFLEQLLKEAGLAREEVFLTQAVKHFRFETRALQRCYRSPSPEHIEACRGWLEQELARLPARVIVALGRTAVKALGLPESEASLSEEILPVESGIYYFLPTWHPAYALRAPDAAARAMARAHIVASLRSARQRAAVKRCQGEWSGGANLDNLVEIGIESG